MAINKLLPFANGDLPNVLDYATWNALPGRVTGFQSGIANSKQFNYILAQGGAAGYVIGQLVADELNLDATFDCTTLYANFKRAIATFVGANLPAGSVTTDMLADGAVTFPKIAPAAIATQIQAQEGTVNNVLMTPLRVAEAIAAQIPPGVPAGTVAFFAQRAVPAGWLICNGANVSRTIYASLFAAIGTTYGEGDGSTTFTLPNAHRRFLEATTTTSEVGGPIAAGLPNVTGAFGSMSHISATGAFLGSGDVDPLTGGTTGGGVIYTDFSANRSSAIYGSSSGVQPNSIRLLVCIKF